MAYACIPDDPAEIAAKILRHHRTMAALNRWIRLCGRDADEAEIERNDEDYIAAHAEMERLRKAKLRAAR